MCHLPLINIPIKREHAAEVGYKGISHRSFSYFHQCCKEPVRKLLLTTRMLGLKLLCLSFVFFILVDSKALEESKSIISMESDDEIMEGAESQNPFLPRFAMRKLRERSEKANAQRRYYLGRRRRSIPMGDEGEMMEGAESQNPFLPRFAMRKLKERSEKANSQRRNYQGQRRLNPPRRVLCPYRYY